MPVIEILKNDQVVRRVPVQQPEFVVGRHEGCDLILDDEWISRRHLSFSRTEAGSWEAVDLGSGNGSYVGSERIASMSLHHGDVVRLGSSLLRFIEQEDDHTQEVKPEENLVANQALKKARSQLQILQAEVDVLRAAVGSQGQPKTGSTANLSSVLNPRLSMHFHRPFGQVGAKLGRAPKDNKGILRWGFLGLGRIGDGMTHALSRLGRNKARVLLESLVPKSRVKSSGKYVIRLNDDGGAVALPDAIGHGVASMVPWLSADEKPLTDLFIMFAADLFGEGSLATSRLSQFLRTFEVKERGKNNPRKHLLLIQDTSHEQVDPAPFKVMLDLGLLQSVLAVDQERVGNFAHELQDEQTAFVATAGVLDSAQRLARRVPDCGAWTEKDLAAFLSQAGFSTLGCSAAESLEDLGQAIEDLTTNGLFHAGFATGMPRQAFLLAVVGSELMNEDSEFPARLVSELEGAASKWPQAKQRVAIYLDSGSTIRLFAGLGGQARCEFSSRR